MSALPLSVLASLSPFCPNSLELLFKLYPTQMASNVKKGKKRKLEEERKSEGGKPFLTTVPDQTLAYIMSFLDVCSIVAIQMTTTHFNAVQPDASTEATYVRRNWIPDRFVQFIRHVRTGEMPPHSGGFHSRVHEPPPTFRRMITADYMPEDSSRLTTLNADRPALRCNLTLSSITSLTLTDYADHSRDLIPIINTLRLVKLSLFGTYDGAHFTIPTLKELQVRSWVTWAAPLEKLLTLRLDWEKDPATLHTLCFIGDSYPVRGGEGYHRFEGENIRIPHLECFSGLLSIVTPVVSLYLLDSLRSTKDLTYLQSLSFHTPRQELPDLRPLRNLHTLRIEFERVASEPEDEDGDIREEDRDDPEEEEYTIPTFPKMRELVIGPCKLAGAKKLKLLAWLAVSNYEDYPITSEWHPSVVRFETGMVDSRNFKS